MRVDQDKRRIDLGESVVATVGQQTKGTRNSAAAARAASSTLPPPAPMTAAAPAARAAATMHAISALVHSPAKSWMAWAIPASPSVFAQTGSSNLRGDGLVTRSTGPDNPSAAISAPSDCVASYPCV